MITVLIPSNPSVNALLIASSGLVFSSIPNASLILEITLP